jgi:beta-glucuronidase
VGGISGRPRVIFTLMPNYSWFRALSFALTGLALFLSAPAISAATRIDLNGQWRFRIDPSSQGEALGWWKQVPDDTETVAVPHTWNIGPHEDFEGTAWYFRTFDVPVQMQQLHIELHFGATFYVSRVWLNGTELGRHEGGHTSYWFDVTPHLKRANLIVVEVNNQPRADSIPGFAKKLGPNAWYDWWHYGGIVRDVWLTANQSALIRRQQLRVKVQGNVANVISRVFLENFSTNPSSMKVVATAISADGRSAGPPVERRVTIKPGAQDEAVALSISPVKLWSFDQPNLYQLRIDLFDVRDTLVDSLLDNFGARTIEIRDRHLYLNGESVRLTGMTRHEDSPWEGLAESAGTIRHDYDELKELQVTLTRPVHYPQHPAVLDYCDRNGILLIPEIPMWQFNEQQMSDPRVTSLARQMMREMIEQAFNHPSIFAWSACNESASDTPGGRAYFKIMYDTIKELDPDRYVSFANDRVGFVKNAADDAASLADFIMLNQYFGTWQGAASLLPVALDRINKNYPDKMLIISEFGAASIFAADTESGDSLRARVIRDQLKTFRKYDWIAGAIFWCYQDYKSHRNLWPGLLQGEVEMGVVDQNRQRRPSFEVWREENSPAQIDLSWNQSPVYPYRPVGFRAMVERRRTDDMPSYTLRGYRVTWEVRSNDNVVVASGENNLPDIGPAHSIEPAWEPDPGKSLSLHLRLYRPNNYMALEKKLTWWEPRSGGQDVKERKQLMQ